jgi:hypothetical protein
MSAAFLSAPLVARLNGPLLRSINCFQVSASDLRSGAICCAGAFSPVPARFGPQQENTGTEVP